MTTTTSEIAKKWTEKELTQLRAQLYTHDELTGYKTIQIRQETQEALLELSRELKGDTLDKTYDSIILQCIEAYKKIQRE